MTDGIIKMLDRSHAAILDGRFAELAELAQQIEARFPLPAGLDRDVAEILRQKCERNQECLAAALAGVRSAQWRLREIARAARGISIYDQRGATALLGGQPASERRA